MEVHPPEHGIHSLRDFLVHMGTITLGLLIALSLEGLVELQHHRHLVHTARHNLRQEEQRNLATLDRDAQQLARVHSDLNTDLHTLRGLHSAADRAHAHLVSNWSWDSLAASAYDTARNTEAFAFMPYDEVQGIDAVYEQQHYLNDAALPYIAAVNHIRLPLQGGRTLADASDADIARMVDDCSSALLQIELVHDLMSSLHNNLQQSAAAE